MKKIIAIALVLAILLAVVLCIVFCDKDEGGAGSSPDTPSTEDTSEEEKKGNGKNTYDGTTPVRLPST